MIIGIGGGTGSGKTTVAQKIMGLIDGTDVLYLQQDSYYRDFGEMPAGTREHVNFDHPDAFDIELLIDHLESLRAGKIIDRPVYDFKTHSRRSETVRVEPLPIMLIEGILVFHEQRMRGLMDLKVFVDCDADIRFIRRLERDVRERERSVESVIVQYLATVRPMHQQFVAPMMKYADIVLSEGGCDPAGIDRIIDRIRSANRITNPPK